MTTTTTETAPFDREVIASLSRRPDIDIHVSTVKVLGESYVDVREFIVSLGQYGRGIILPLSSARFVADALKEVADAEDDRLAEARH